MTAGLPPLTLHLGAHRTGCASLHALLQARSDSLRRARIAVWSTAYTRSDLFDGLLGDPGRSSPDRSHRARRAAGRIAMRRQELGGLGIRRLLLSDPALLGAPRENVLLARLYPSAWARLRRLRGAAPGIDRVCLTVRAPSGWWCSTFLALIARGFPPPDRASLSAIARSRRGWREVVEDVADALPRARITVLTHEAFGHRPDATFARLTGLPSDPRDRPHHRAAPTLDALRSRLRAEGCTVRLPEDAGRYAPFTSGELAALDAAHENDLAWLRSGADGLADFAGGIPNGPPPTDDEGATHVRT
jgi:hypothetical protein